MNEEREDVQQRLIALGKRIREARGARGLSLEALSEKADISSSLLSQIERGQGNPSYTTIVKLARTLEIPFAAIFQKSASQSGIVVRQDQRRKLMLPNTDIVFESLSPDVDRRVEVFQWEFAPGFTNCDEPPVHKGEETLVVISGELEVKVGEDLYHLSQGDSIYIGPEVPHSYANQSDQRVLCISAVSPPPF